MPLSLQTAPVLSHSVAGVGLPRTLLLLPAYSQNRADSVGSTAKSSANLFSLILASVSLPRRGQLVLAQPGGADPFAESARRGTRGLAHSMILKRR